MKKLILTIAIVLGLGTASFAQTLFNRDGNDQEEMYSNRLGGLPVLPDHDQDTDQDAAPLTGGALLLIGFGAAYAMSKRNKK